MNDELNNATAESAEEEMIDAIVEDDEVDIALEAFVEEADQAGEALPVQQEELPEQAQEEIPMQEEIPVQTQQEAPARQQSYVQPPRYTFGQGMPAPTPPMPQNGNPYNAYGAYPPSPQYYNQPQQCQPQQYQPQQYQPQQYQPQQYQPQQYRPQQYQPQQYQPQQYQPQQYQQQQYQQQQYQQQQYQQQQYQPPIPPIPTINYVPNGYVNSTQNSTQSYLRQQGSPVQQGGPVPQGIPVPQPYPMRAPKKKPSLGLRVFLWILGSVAVISVIGFIIWGVYESSSAMHNWGNNGNNLFGNYLPRPDSPNEPEPTPEPDPEPALPEPMPGADDYLHPAPSGDGTSADFLGIALMPKANRTISASDLYEQVISSVVGVQAVDEAAGSSNEGTGIIATADGYVITNAHVVNNSRLNKVTVLLHDGSRYGAKVVGYDKTSDLAVLKIDAKGLSPAVFGDADQMRVGDEVIAIGNPGGINYAGSLTGGRVSALNRVIDDRSNNGMTYIQTDAAINPGNSGGPLLSMYGQVIGINSNKIVATDYEGMGFAIPISRAQRILTDLIRQGYVGGRARIGITGRTEPGTDALPPGVLIVTVADDSPFAGKARAGDVIVNADDSEIYSMDDLFAVLAAHEPGDEVEFSIYNPQTGKTKSIRVVLMADKGETQN